MTRGGFLARFGTVSENRPDLATAAWERGPVDTDAGAAGLHRAFVAVLRGVPPDAVLAFLNDHPDLAGQSTRLDDLTPVSRSAITPSTCGTEPLPEVP